MGEEQRCKQCGSTNLVLEEEPDDTWFYTCQDCGTTYQ